MAKKIIVNFDSRGKIHVETEGYKGESCLQSIKNLFTQMAEIEEFELKEDYYENEEEITIKEKVTI